MKYGKINDEVYLAEGSIVQIHASDLEFIKKQALLSPKKRARLCAHPDSRDRLHEMLIVLDRETYVRPHRHGSKSESFHVIEGTIDVFLFNANGVIQDIISLGDHASGKPFFFRMMDDVFHAPVITSKYALFHETTNGPFNRQDTEFASWAPEENDISAVSAFLARLRQASAQWSDRSACSA